MQNNSNVPEIENSVPAAIQIQDSLTQIYDIIDKVGQHLENTFHTQEDRFLEEYRKQMYSAQRNLREYTKTHSQAELTKKIEEKERALRAEREKALNETIQSSNKIKELKTHANNLKQTANNLEDEINFIDDQAVLSEEKNRRLTEEANFLKLEILKLKPDFEFWEENLEGGNTSDLRAEPLNSKGSRKGSHSNSMINSVDLGRKTKQTNLKMASYRKKTEGWKDFYSKPMDGFVDEREIERIKKQHDFESHNFDILSRMNEDPAFMKGRFEEIFEECITKALEKNAEKLVAGPYSKSGKLPLVARSLDGAFPEEDISQADTNINFDRLKLAEMKLSEQEKKVMIEEFMSNKDVKEYFFKKFTEEAPKKPPARMF